MGPTAAGKSALALHLAERLPVEVVSVDSASVYRGLDIGTAKPDPATRARVPHALVDIMDPDEPYSAARFVGDATAAIVAIRSRGKVPLLVGGTMLYFRALFPGLSELPPADPAVRAAIDDRAQRDGWASLHAELVRVDPAAAARIHPNDPQRIQRALEVYEITGRPISELQGNRQSQIGSHEPDGSYGWVVRKLVVCPEDRAELHGRIERRVGAMFEAGLIDEVRSFSHLDPDLPSMRAVGYRQVRAWLDAGGEGDRPVKAVVHATRQMAKRQLTWLRREPGLEWLDPTAPDWLEKGLHWGRCATIERPETLGKKEYGDG